MYYVVHTLLMDVLHTLCRRCQKLTCSASFTELIPYLTLPYLTLLLGRMPARQTPSAEATTQAQCASPRVRVLMYLLVCAVLVWL